MLRPHRGALCQPVISDGNFQHRLLCRQIGHLLRHNCDYQIARGLIHAWNSAWCKPPPGYRELERIVGRIARHEIERIERELAR